MFLIHRPSLEFIDRFLTDSRALPLSYAPVGISETAPPGYVLDEEVVTIGRGPADYERARAALIAWEHYAFDWVELHPPRPAIAVGTTVVLLARHLGFWSLNGCRIVRVIGDGEHDCGFGFAYGTLTNHAERGEEIFEVFMDAETGDVKYRIRAVSKARALLARFGYPVTRALQARFRCHSAEVMRRAANGLGAHV